MKDNNATFSEMYHRLQEIADRLKSSDIIDIDEILKLQEEAKKLYEVLNSLLQKATNEEQRS